MRRGGLPFRRVFPVLLALFFLALSGLIVWSGEIASYHFVNHDVANALYIGRRVLEGDLLYVDWFYFVTPPVVQLSAAACALALWLGLTPQTAIHALLLASAGLGVAVLRRALPGPGAAGALAVLAYLGVLVHVGHTPRDFAQREHWFALLFVPYLLWRVALRQPSPAVYSLLATLGFACAIKPHFAVAVALVEVCLLRERVARRGVWACLAGGAALPFALLALQPESLRGFFTQMLPFYAEGRYDAFGAPPGGYLGDPKHLRLLALGSGAASLALLCRIRGRLSARAARVGTGVGLLLYASIWQQAKFFDYHQIPFLATAWVLAVLLAWRAASGVATPKLRRALLALAVAAPLLLAGRGLVWLARVMTRPPWPRVQQVLPLLEGHDLIVLLSPAVEPVLFSHLLDRGIDIMRPWTSHYRVPSLLAIEDPAERERALRDYFDGLARRMDRERPGLVVFSPSQQALGGATLHDVFVDRYPLFPTPDYRLRGRTASGWSVYERNGGGAPSVPESGGRGRAPHPGAPSAGG